MVWSLQSVSGGLLAGLFTYPEKLRLMVAVVRLAPKYEELAALYFNDPSHSKQVIVAKVDATSNDVPDEIAGFPTIKMFPAGSKESPIEYAGERTVRDLAEFIKENGKYKVDAYVGAGGDEESPDGGVMPDAEAMGRQAAAATEKAGKRPVRRRRRRQRRLARAPSTSKTKRVRMPSTSRTRRVRMSSTFRIRRVRTLDTSRTRSRVRSVRRPRRSRRRFRKGRMMMLNILSCERDMEGVEGVNDTG